MIMIAQNLFAARQNAGITQAALARLCGIAQPNIAAFERGQRQPSMQSILKLAQGLNLAPETLLADRQEAKGLSRHDFEAIALGLAKAQPRGPLDHQSWQDLQALFHSKLRAFYPSISRRRPRISASAALMRLKALHTASFIQRLNDRFLKLNLERS
jgi:transcriptional regulator with XRE-family HTH domain